MRDRTAMTGVLFIKNAGQLDLAEREGIKRSEMIRRLVEAGMKALARR
jgi:hypothetical protein